jgi:MoaA/NifB/PqqE/SkfB family radical SAM enzyme
VENSLELLAALRAAGTIDAHLYFTLMRPTLKAYEDVFVLSQRFKIPFVVNLLDDTPYFFEGIKGKSKDLWIGRESASAMKEFQRFLALKKREFPALVYHTYTEIDFFRKYFSDPLQRDKPCIVSQLRLGIDAHGGVFGGCWSMGAFGNIRKQPLKEIVSSPAYQKAHRNMFYKKCPGCSCGYTTSLRYFIPSRMREIVYKAVPGLRQRIHE